jgi:hypothetical protein
MVKNDPDHLTLYPLATSLRLEKSLMEALKIDPDNIDAL